MDPVYVVGLFAAGIGGLWFALNQSHKTQLADKDKQLAERDLRIEKLEGKVDKLSDLQEQNLNMLNRMANTLDIQERLQRRALSSVTVTNDLPISPGDPPTLPDE